VGLIFENIVDYLDDTSEVLGLMRHLGDEPEAFFAIDRLVGRLGALVGVEVPDL
jgi:hypothetical protein